MTDIYHHGENEITEAAECLVAHDAELPDYVKDHLERCISCKRKVLEVSEIIHAMPQ